MNIKEYYISKGTSRETLLKMLSTNKENKHVSLNNRAINGNNIKTELTNKISITKPKFWPQRGFYEY